MTSLTMISDCSVKRTEDTVCSNISVSSASTKSSMPSNSRSDRDGSVRVHSGSGFRFVVPFPWRLHQILDDMDESGDTSIVSWMPDGRHFHVHNPTLFVKEIIPKFFKQKSFKSFQRQLHIYGFQRVADFPNQGENEKLSVILFKHYHLLTKPSQYVHHQVLTFMKSSFEEIENSHWR